MNETKAGSHIAVIVEDFLLVDDNLLVEQLLGQRRLGRFLLLFVLLL